MVQPRRVPKDGPTLLERPKPGMPEPHAPGVKNLGRSDKDRPYLPKKKHHNQHQHKATKRGHKSHRDEIGLG